MKYLHLCSALALAAVSGLAAAATEAVTPGASAPAPTPPVTVEWTAIGGNPDITFYADMASLVTRGSTVTMWTLVGAKTERSQGAIRFSSIKTWFEFDCAGPRIRELQTQFHAGPMGDGAVVGGYAEAGAWEAVAEGTVKEGLAQIACPAPESKPSAQAGT